VFDIGKCLERKGGWKTASMEGIQAVDPVINYINNSVKSLTIPDVPWPLPLITNSTQDPVQGQA